MVTKPIAFVLLPTLVVLTVGGTPTHAEDELPAPARAPTPSLFHSPPTTLDAGRSFELDARVLDEPQLEALWVEVRPAADALTHPAFDGFEAGCREASGDYVAATRTCTLVLRRRARPEIFGATIPGPLVQPPGITYIMMMRPKSGEPEAAFATRASPHPVLVIGESTASRRADRLARHRGHTSQLALRTDVSMFGRTRVDTVAEPTRSEPFSDAYGSVEIEYTSRPLTTLYAFRMGLGLMRGQRAQFERADGARVSVGDGPEPGLNYGFGEVDIELGRTFYLTPRLTLGASEAGFSAGVGTELTIGRMTSTRLLLGVDWVSDLGARGWLTFAWTTVRGFPMGLTVELTEHPSAETNTLGSRLIYDLGIEIGQAFTLDLRVGYAQRATSFDGGFVVGLGARYEF